MDAIEAMETTRAIRFLKPDPVPEALIERVIYAATRASSPGNSQGWDFVVVRDRAIKQRIGPVLRERMLPLVRSMPSAPGAVQRMLRGAQHLLQSFEDVPVWILVCGRKVYPPGAGTEQMVHAALYPAAQNLIVAARSLGLGTTFTTFQLAAEAEMRAVLKLPSDVSIGVCVALGYPDRAFGPVVRKPVANVIHWDQW
ncbi:MAG TPA: nitroreductase family protein [Myxococcota bacterium]|jgi:nitroreductase